MWVIGLFWLIQFLELSVVAYAEGGARSLHLLVPRAVINGIGICLTLVVVEVAARSIEQPFRARLVRTLAAAFAMCLILVPINLAVFSWTMHGVWGAHDFITFIYTGFTWSWFMFSVAGALLALTYSYDARDRERRLALAEAEARDARMAALRYQLNPHFLFNTLNSIASLIDAGEAGPAEQMVENLSDFLRVTLELDPVSDIELAHEIQLQALYLSIEEARFPARLRARYSIPDELEAALVPALITQPLVENAVRHAVAKSLRPVSVEISAARHGDRLRLSVIDDKVGAACGEPVKPGVGLANVRARLEGRFGAEQGLLLNRGARSGFAATIEMPLRFRA